jgi:hypothetical protein
MSRRAKVRLVSALMVAGAGCASNAERSEPSAELRLHAAAQGLCDAETLARDGDVAGARNAFVNRSHSYLHELAAEITDRDPAAAAALLEAKQRVEATLGDTSDTARLAQLVAELLEAMDVAATAAGLGDPTCRNEEAA